MLENLNEIADVLRDNGYDVTGDAEIIQVQVIPDGVPAILTITDSANGVVLNIKYQVLTGAQLLDDIEIPIALLDLNSRTSPYAFELITDKDSSEVISGIGESPVFLSDCIPVGDISEEELLYAIRSLLTALSVASPILRAINEVGEPVTV